MADRTLTVFSLFFYSLPTFVLGLTLLYFFYFKLTLAGITFFPPGGYVELPADPFTWFRSLILPWLTLALVPGRALHPAHPRIAARRARGGLHPDGAVQGPRRTARGLPPRRCAAR